MLLFLFLVVTIWVDSQRRPLGPTVGAKMFRGVGTESLLKELLLLRVIFLLSNNFNEIHSSARSVGMAIGVPV